jgi:hypothetical protein
VGSRATLRGRRGIPIAKRALYFSRLRNAVSNAYWDSDGYTDRNADGDCDSERNTEPKPNRHSYNYTYSNPAATSHTATPADAAPSFYSMSTLISPLSSRLRNNIVANPVLWLSISVGLS